MSKYFVLFLHLSILKMFKQTICSNSMWTCHGFKKVHVHAWVLCKNLSSDMRSQRRVRSSLRIHAVWSETSLSVWRTIGSLVIYATHVRRYILSSVVVSFWLVWFLHLAFQLDSTDAQSSILHILCHKKSVRPLFNSSQTTDETLKIAIWLSKN